MKEKSTILIVDDSELNRTILADILGDEYNFIEAENGARAIELLRTHTDIDLILLDMVMPEMNGFDVLTAMNNNRQIEDIPVVMISAENGIEHIERAYDLGVTDYISRPFDRMVVHRRVVNALILAAKQKRLMRLAAEQIYEKEKISDMMINIFSHIVEFRNGESGPHVLHIRTITEVLLNRLVQKTDRYSLTQEDIQLISNASALHDIGKVSIPDEIINKPGKLTKEEFEIMKSHTTVGADILHDLPFSNEEPLLKTAYEIARWHHERYDGRGYPDGLTGEEIPIAAQVVSVADVYDALTSVRCYKSAYDHETALRMIINGECARSIRCCSSACSMRRCRSGSVCSRRTRDIRTARRARSSFRPKCCSSRRRRRSDVRFRRSRPSASRPSSLPSSPAAFSSTMIRQRAPSLWQTTRTRCRLPAACMMRRIRKNSRYSARMT